MRLYRDADRREFEDMIWMILGIVLLAGGVGGLVNAVLTGNGFPLPRAKRSGDIEIWMPGVLGNVFVAAVGAAVSWGLYGPVSAVTILSNQKPDSPVTVGLTLSSLVGAVLVGAAGARWWSSEIDKQLFQAAASQAAAAKAATPEQVNRIMAASPQHAFDLAAALPK